MFLLRIEHLPVGLLGPTSFQLYLGTILVCRNLTKLPAWEAPTRGHVLKFFEPER